MSLEATIKSAKYTVLLGKNGAGKSTHLRQLSAQSALNIKYISPERGGTLKYDPNVENNIASNEGWLQATRNKNRFEQFREQSAAQFRSLELLFLREIEKDQNKRSDHGYTFGTVLEKINNLLPAISLVRSDRGFSIQSKSGTPISEDQISSGESELIALAIEVLVFSKFDKAEKILLMDEPDVHLHPDLQHRFVAFVEEVATACDMRVVIATHSTAIIGSFAPSSDLIIVPITQRNQAEFNPFRRARISEEILPIFGAHPLSNVFNGFPVILVEGEDDRRVIDQLVRSSGGGVRLSPCVVGSVSELAEWELWLNEVLPAIYDNPVGFSLRDLDESETSDLNDVGFVCRARLNCYAMENLLLTTESLQLHGFTEASFCEALRVWSERFPAHKYRSEIDNLENRFSERRIIKIKDIRNIIVAVLESNKPWEVIVGQLLANHSPGVGASNPNSLETYLGEKAARVLFR